MADALGLERSPEVEVLEQVIGHLAAQPWLLVLDNYEHLVEAGALWMRTLLERASTLTCLVTSRQRLGISGEQEFALLPLPTPRGSGVQAFRGSGVQAGKVKNGPAVDLAGPERLDARTPERLMQFPSVQLFVDRAEELESARRTLENRGNVLLSGPRGIGKSSLLAALARRLRDDDVPVLSVNGRVARSPVELLTLLRAQLGGDQRQVVAMNDVGATQGAHLR